MYTTLQLHVYFTLIISSKNIGLVSKQQSEKINFLAIMPLFSIISVIIHVKCFLLIPC